MCSFWQNRIFCQNVTRSYPLIFHGEFCNFWKKNIFSKLLIGICNILPNFMIVSHFFQKLEHKVEGEVALAVMLIKKHVFRFFPTLRLKCAERAKNGYILPKITLLAHFGSLAPRPDFLLLYLYFFINI